MEKYKSGFVTLLGRPNVGKSTLINKLIGKKITITSPIAQTTRNKLRGILTTKESQIIFIDTPGLHKPHHLLGEALVKNAKSAVKGVDLVLLVFDSSEQPGRGDTYIKDFLIKTNSEFIVVLNKWDTVNADCKKQREIMYRELFFGKKVSFFNVSALNGDGCNKLIRSINDCLPNGPMLYPDDIICDQPLNILLAELVREQVLLNTREEIPHSVAVQIEKIQEIKRDNGKCFTIVMASIIVERKSQKGIIIGKNGSMLKEIGQSARINMKKLIDGAVHLELFVKVIPNWRKKASKVSEFGYEDKS